MITYKCLFCKYCNPFELSDKLNRFELSDKLNCFELNDKYVQSVDKWLIIDEKYQIR